MKKKELTLETYAELAPRTLTDLGSLKLNISHMSFGIVEELDELMAALVNEDTVNIVEEAGDICWYCVNGIKLIDNNFDFSIEHPELEKLVSYLESSALVTETKRFIAYNKENTDVLLILYYNTLSVIMEMFNLKERPESVSTFNETLFKNIEKLNKRYPEKYSDFNALNRNLEAERKTLEQ